MIEGQGLRERKKQETSHALRRAAMRLVAENGLDRVTVADIAQAADVSVRTFFNHFPCKEDAVVGSELQRVQLLRSTLADQSADLAPIPALHVVIMKIAEILGARRDEMMLEMRVVLANPALHARKMSEFALYEQALVADVAKRSGTDPSRDLYPLLTARAAVAAFRAALSLWCSPSNTRNLPDLVDEAFDELAQGLPPPRA